MKTVQHSATLFYYDGPQVIEARDRIGGHYVGVAVGSDDEGFMLVGVPPSRIRDFRSGICDLRTLILENAAAGWWLAGEVADLGKPMELTSGSGDLDALGYLPDEGFLLQPALDADDSLTAEACARNNVVWQVTLEPPEASEQHRIRAATYSTALTLLQSLVKYAYGKAVASMPKAAKKSLDTADAFWFDVVIPAAPGSFRFMLEAARPPDLFGYAEIARGLERLDTLFTDPGDPAATLAILQENRGHLAAAYIRLMDFLVRNRTGIRYTWAQPGKAKSVSRSVSEAQAKPLYESLSRAERLAQETVIVMGHLRKVDLDSATWRLGNYGEDGERHGKVREGGPSLSHLITDQLYRFTCEEVIEEITGTGRELRTLYLTDAQELTEKEALAAKMAEE